MSNQNPYYYVDEKNSAERGEEGNNNSSTNKNVPPISPNQDKINKPSVGLKMAIDELRAIINAQEKKQTANNSSDKNHNHEEQKILKDQPVSSSLPQEQKSCSILTATPAAPPQSNAHADSIPKTDSSRVESPDHQATENIHPATKVNNNETKEGWGWWSAKVGLSCLKWSISSAVSMIKLGLELFRLLPLHIQLLSEIIGLGGSIAVVGYMFKNKIKQKFYDFLGTTKQKVQNLALETVASVTANATANVTETLQPVVGLGNDIAATINYTVNRFTTLDKITLHKAKQLIQAGKNKELAKYLTYEKQITCDESDKSDDEEIKENNQLEDAVVSVISEEPEQETKLEEPEPAQGEPEQKTPLHRQLLEEAIKCNNVEAVKLLLKCKDSLLESAKEVSLNAIPDVKNIAVSSDDKAKFQGVDIKGDKTLLSQAMVKLFELYSSFSQLELSSSVVGTTQEVTLENIGKVEITFEKIDEDPYWMRANCVVNKGTKDEYSIKLFCKIAQEGTQITNGESAQVNVLESEEFQKFLTKSINDYRNSLHNSLNIIDYLLKQGADPNNMDAETNLQYTIPLNEAFYHKNQELFVVLLKNQAKPETDLIRYTFGYKDPPQSENKPFYELLSTPHCNSLGVQLWKPWLLDDTVPPGDDDTKEQGKELSFAEIHQGLTWCKLSQSEDVEKQGLDNRSFSKLPGANEKREETEALNIETGRGAPAVRKFLPNNKVDIDKNTQGDNRELNPNISNPPAMQLLPGGDNNANVEENEQKETGAPNIETGLGAPAVRKFLPNNKVDIDKNTEGDNRELNPNISDNPSAMQLLPSGDNNANVEENAQEEYNPLQDPEALKLQLENKASPPPSTAASANQFTSDDSKNHNSNSSLQKLNNVGNNRTYRSQQLQKKLPPTTSSSLGQVVIYDTPNSRKKATVNYNIPYSTPKNTPGMKPLELGTPQYPGPLDDNNKKIATTPETSVTVAKMQENLNNVEKTNKAQPLVLSNQQATPATPPNIENFPSVPSSQDLPVVIVSPKNPNPQNDNIVSIPKSDEMFYKDLLPKQRILWQEQFAKNMIEEFMKFNNISEESVRNLDIVVKNLLKIMHNPEALLKFMNDMFQAAQKSDSNHQDPFLTIMYGEEKSGELSSNSKIVNISTESYLKLLDQIFFYISVTDPLRHDYMTRGVAETIDEDGNKVTNFLTTQQMEQEEEHEIQKNQYDKALFSKFGKGTSNLRDIYFIIQNIRQNGFRQDHLKAIVGGESLPEIILKLPKTILRHAVKITEITINNATNAENYMMAAHGAKIMLGYGTQSAQNLITGIKPLLSLTGGDKADEPIALKPQSGLMGIRGFWQGKLGVGANLLGNFRWNENAPPVPTDEETKEESVEKTPVVLNPLSDSGVSGGNPINAEISTANTTETPEAQDSLIPSASGPSENPEGQQKLGIAVVGEKLGEVVGGKFGKIIGRSIARFAENVIETSRRNAEKQHVKSDDDSSGQCDDRSNNDNPDFPSDDITNPSDEQIQQEEEIVGGNVNDDCTQSSFQATLYYTNNPFDLFS